ncbi:G3E family GTPase [Paraburkholderia sp. BL27I4N3]|uniref:CobW family GTP-binding protein n=1 Tax=Paraburkholderia sp. BL27I4N3 TaxID=1938805 RepID=UPI000E2538B3|nr:GTP-binding protein [Paraburkholderia sp. BL27I4N3]REE23176.1 G3E family GTPase [Paraburkholderia sp. BL27I4N3]
MDTTSGNDQRIPITLLTGFLGAGKTTLVNRILSNPAGDKIAVIVNEFGEIGIDGDLISRTSDDMMELSNGCICCSSKDDLMEALYKLYMRRAGLASPKIEFDRVLIETTGLANPLPLAQAFYTDMSLSLTYRLDAIVTLVDMKHVSLQLRDAAEAERQIALADKIFMTKRDLVDDVEFERGLSLVAALNPFAPRRLLNFGEAAIDEILDIGLFDPNTGESSIEKWIGEDVVCANPDEHDHHEGHCETCAQHRPHTHHHVGVYSVSFREARPLEYEKFLSFLSQLTRTYDGSLYRVKGLINFHGTDRPVIVQGVQSVFSPLTYADGWPQGVAETRLVVIGKGLERERMSEAFRACVSTNDDAVYNGLVMV